MKELRSVLLLDGYIDDPAALGVPPFISPLVRAVAGAVIDSGASVEYLTIDMLRSGYQLNSATDLSVVVAGNTVPGRYLRSLPASRREIFHILPKLSGPIVGNLHNLTTRADRSFDYESSIDVAALVYDLLICLLYTSEAETVSRRTI